MRINTNIASLNAREANTNTNKQLNSSLEKLSSGLRINKASDDASGLAIADKLRTQASAIGQSISNGNSAIALTQIADKAMAEQSNILDIVNKTRTFKTLNSQINATSKGFSNLNKYNGINTIIINETELRQELKDQTGEVNTLGHRLIKNRNCKNLIVTSGQQGAKLFKKNVKMRTFL